MAPNLNVARAKRPGFDAQSLAAGDIGRPSAPRAWLSQQPACDRLFTRFLPFVEKSRALVA
jgi:hypothetical protein